MDGGSSSDFVVFVTKKTFSGNLGGVAGADEECQTAAAAAGLAGTFRAWLSDFAATKNAIDQVPEGGPWRKLALGRDAKLGDIVFTNRDNWKGYPRSPIDVNELGEATPAGNAVGSKAWTGTDVGGKAYGNSTCRSWDSVGTSYGGLYGSPGNVDKWTRDDIVIGCGLSAALICYQTTR